jgi:hypothetical protein
MAEEIPTETLAETENYSVWLSQEPDGEMTYHVEIGAVTLHFFDEEWTEFRELMRALPTDERSGKSSGQKR